MMEVAYNTYISKSWPSGSGLWRERMGDLSGNKEKPKHEDWTNVAEVEKRLSRHTDTENWPQLHH